MKYVKTPRGMTVILDGRPTHLPEGIPRYAELERAVLANNEPLFRLLLEEGRGGLPEALLQDRRITFDRGSLWWAASGANPVLMHGLLSQSHLRAALGGYGLTGFTRLCEAIGDQPAKLGLVAQLGTRITACGSVLARAALNGGGEGEAELFPEGSNEGVPALVSPVTVQRRQGGVVGFARALVEREWFIAPTPGAALAPRASRVRVEVFDSRQWTTTHEDETLYAGLDAAEEALASASEVRVYLDSTPYVLWVGHNPGACVEVWEGVGDEDEAGVRLGSFSSLSVARHLLSADVEREAGWMEIRRNRTVLVRKEL